MFCTYKPPCYLSGANPFDVGGKLDTQVLFGVGPKSDKPRILPVSFEVKLAELRSKYRELIPPHGEAISPLDVIENFRNVGDHPSCSGEVFQLELFIKNLVDIKDRRPEIFSKLRRKVYRCGSLSNHIGLRTEARIASSLARKNLEFAYGDAPDFSVSINGSTIFIESTNVKLDDVYLGIDPRNKLARALREKSGKSYANLRTAVSIDATGIFAVWQTQGIQGEKTDLKQFLTPTLEKLNLGAVIIFSLSYSMEDSWLSYNYSRIDSPRISKELQLFLDQQYPFGDFRAKSPEFPGARPPLVVYRANYSI